MDFIIALHISQDLRYLPGSWEIFLDKKPLYKDKLTGGLYFFFFFLLFCLLSGDWEWLGMKAKVQLPQSKALFKHKPPESAIPAR